MKKVCVITGSRAEYGLLHWLMRDIQSEAELRLQLIVTGSHLSPDYGYTLQSIHKDGFIPDAIIEIPLCGESSLDTIASLAEALRGIGEALAALSPDIVVLLGDRYEIFAAATACLHLSIPIAHLHGGELTEAVTDDAMRHSISKMSQLHFTAAEEYRQRVIQLGEHPSHVWNVGAMVADQLRRGTFLSKEQLEKDLDFAFDQPLFVVTYHPLTLGAHDSAEEITALHAALEKIDSAKFVITAANADAGGKTINQLSRKFAARHPARVKFVESLGHQRYLSLLKLAHGVIGNSSSGIIEAPLLHVPTLNIGDRQTGRLMAPSIVQSECEMQKILSGFERLTSPQHRAVVKFGASPYHAGVISPSAAIVSVIKNASLKQLVRKSFYQLQVVC